MLHCLILLFLLPLHVSVSVTADDQRLSATLPDAPISPSTVSVSVTADDQRLSATLPDAPISPSTVSVSVTADDQRLLTLLLHLLNASVNNTVLRKRRKYSENRHNLNINSSVLILHCCLVLSAVLLALFS